VNVAEYLDWCINTQDHGLVFKNSLTFFSESNDVLATEGKVAISIELSSPLSWSKQVVQEQVVERVLLHGWLLRNVRADRLVLCLFQLSHCHVDSFACTWLGFNFGSVELDFVFHAGKALHGWSALSVVGVISLSTLASFLLAFVFLTNRLLELLDEGRDFNE